MLPHVDEEPRLSAFLRGRLERQAGLPRNGCAATIFRRARFGLALCIAKQNSRASPSFASLRPPIASLGVRARSAHRPAVATKAARGAVKRRGDHHDHRP
jgi:hypothetical protein